MIRLYGNLAQENVFMNNFPELSIQSLFTNWWVEDNRLRRGSLIEAFIPHVDQIPYQFEPIGRKIATQHDIADVEVKELRVGQKIRHVALPVSGMPRTHRGEYWSAFRSKVRPCIVIGTSMDEVPTGLTIGMPNANTAHTIIVAPFYGINNGTRAGFNPAFVERVRFLEYRQFFYDQLPHATGIPSILRLDHIMPVGAHSKSYKHLGYGLSEEATQVLEDLLKWNFLDGVSHDSEILTYKEIIEEEI